MSSSEVHAGPHLHLWTRSIDGAEFANAIYRDDVDAAIDFCGMIQDIRKYAIDGVQITIEDVMQSLTEGRGMYAGVPGFILVLSRCDGGCKSPTWN